MHVIWKRPDGYRDAVPEDFKSMAVDSNYKIWLHKNDTTNFPFRISGGWQDEESTKRLNMMVNLALSDKKSLEKFLAKDFEDSQQSDYKIYFSELSQWLDNLNNNLKGDTWETEIMSEVIKHLTGHIKHTPS